MTTIKIGLSMLHCLNEPFHAMLRRLSKLEELDVRYIELVDDGLHSLDGRRVKALRELAVEKGYELFVHAPFADINIGSPNKALRNVMLKRLERSIAYADELDSPLWVFHPGFKTGLTHFYPGLEWEANLSSVRHLFNVAKERGMRVAIENLPEPLPALLKSVDDFLAFYDELNEDVSLALDVGHANLNGQIDLFLSTFRDKIIHMHVSDNDGRNDSHSGIGYGMIDWRRVMKAIRGIKFNGVVMLESVEKVEESLERLRQLSLRRP